MQMISPGMLLEPDPEILNYLSKTSQPTTAIYKKGINVASINKR